MYVEHEFIFSLYRTNKLADKVYPVSSKEFDCCINGCKMYYNDDTSSECFSCRQPRYNKEHKPRSTVSILPLAEQLALRLQDQETKEKLIYRHNYKHRDGIYDDIFAGKTYQKLKNIIKY